LLDEPDLFADAVPQRLEAAASGPRIGPPERLSATMALSAIAFGVLILGVGFALDDPAPVMPTLDVILTNTRSDEAPKDPDFLAQATNKGGGDKDIALRPREPEFGDVPKASPGVSPEPLTVQAPAPAPEYRERLLTTTAPAQRRLPRPEDRDQPPLPLPPGPDLTQQAMQMARLTAENERERQLYAKRPKRKFISASTQEYEFAQYMRVWVAKVERVGTLNLPAEVRTHGLAGELVMTVVVNKEGRVVEMTISTPSGHKALDDAARAIVRQAEPFPTLPKTGEDVDELYITRTWRFTEGGVTTTE
jgi:protein TonB